ncbi:FecR family protein [Pedobacter aquatilis]|uniref:FecR family protein n=1 Tax=Pedobacter aquatilis TaxID=351343 RepID=UPI00292F5BCE|nr:FecR domain-containing protein [Pedobacter aquatilis]
MRTKGAKFLSSQFAHYRKGQLDENSKKVIENWFDEKRTSKPKELPFTSTEEKEIGELLFANIQQTIARKKQPTGVPLLKIAAVMLVLGLAGIAYRFFAVNSIQKTAADRIYATTNAQQRQISLPDGSSIRMNAATLIRVPENFGKDAKRSIILEKGEAFFQIKRDPSRPFVITSGAYRTTVLGTSFNIRLYPEEKKYTLAVASGKVKVERQGKSGFSMLSAGVTKGETLGYDEQTSQRIQANEGAEGYLGWMSGKSTYLKEVDLVQIGAALERLYNLKVKVRDTAGKHRIYTLELARTDIRSTLRMLAKKTGMSYELNQQMLIIKPGL